MCEASREWDLDLLDLWIMIMFVRVYARKVVSQRSKRGIMRVILLNIDEKCTESEHV